MSRLLRFVIWVMKHPAVKKAAEDALQHYAEQAIREKFRQ